MRWFLLLALLVVGTEPMRSDAVTDPCGTWEGAPARLSRLLKYFTDPELADFREGMIERLPADVGRYVVTDPVECTPVYTRALEVLQDSPGWSEMEELGFEYNILRYDQYYAVVVLQNVPEGHFRVGGYALMLIFDAGDLAYLGAGLD